MSTKGATIKAAKSVDEKPKRPRVDRGAEFETLLRQMFVPVVDKWCKDNLPKMPDKEARGSVVDNLVALHTSAFETLVDSVTHAYLSTVTDEEGDDVIDCPKCGEDVVLDDDAETGDVVECPHCHEEFEVPDFDDGDDDDDPDGGERQSA